jgi:hypothetical protein
MLGPPPELQDIFKNLSRGDADFPNIFYLDVVGVFFEDALR